MSPEERRAELEATCRDWHRTYGTFCAECRRVCEAAFEVAPVRYAEDAQAALRAIAQAAELMSGGPFRSRMLEAEQAADDARATAQARELDLLLVALRHDAPIPPLASPGLDAVRRLWERSATYRPALLRRERWALLCEVLPEAARLVAGVKG